MRQIKFRAWHKELRIMREIDMINFAFDEVVVKPENDQFPYRTWFENTFILMQFTGLLDRSGKEIFEGDIINVKFLSTNENIIVKVIYSEEDGAFILTKNDNNSGSFMYEREYIQYEIIGNVWQKPELLESKQ